MRNNIWTFVAVMVVLSAAIVGMKADPIAGALPQTNEWCVITSPTTKNLYGISMASPNEGWAVGQDSTLLHYVSGNWSVVTSPVPAIMSLGEITMVSANEGWAEATGYETPGNYGSKLLRYDGTAWSAIPGLIYQSYRGLSALPGNKVWIAGGGGCCREYGEILYFDGTDLQIQWSADHPYFPAAIQMISPDQGWAVGGLEGLILRYDGHTWQQVASPTQVILWALDLVSASDGWAVGTDGTIVHYNGTAWQTVVSPTSNTLWAIAMVSADDGWAVGNGGGILHYDGSDWSAVQSPTTNDFNAVTMVSPSEGWAVGDNGTILHYIPVHQTFLPLVLKCWPLQPPSTPPLNDIDNPDGDGHYTINWSAVGPCPPVEYYTLQEDDDPSFPSPATVYSGPATSKVISGRDIGTYYYRVQASNAVGTSNWSGTKSVVVTVPPPPCSVTCGANAGGWWADITCESGSYTSYTESFQYWDDTRGWVTHYEIDRTYADSGNTYHISAEYWRVYSEGNLVGRVSMNVTGGVFGDNAQHCQNY